jgi:hypothetical protein
MRLRIEETLSGDNVPGEVCPSCYKQISSLISKGAKLRAEATAREQNKLILWKNRVNLVKQGRTLMSRKSYSEAAVAFEKYLRVLEVVYDRKPGELTPDLFKDSARTKEITVVASVLWDLVRIYDTTPRYGDRQKKAAGLLLEFLKLSPIQSEILRKARQFEGTAKNASIIRDFIKKSDKKSSRCFIATATYQDVDAFEVRALCEFRDQVLSNYTLGKTFIRTYYFFSPSIAALVERSPQMQSFLRKFFGTFAPWLNQRFDLHTPEDV